MAELMKGHCWHERCDAKKRNGDPVVTYPVYVEDKHDEIRCHVKVFDAVGVFIGTPVYVEFLSYAGKPLANMERFEQAFLTLSRGTGYKEFDMGFECNGNFNDSYRWVRSTKGVPADLNGAPFKFYVFGLPEKSVPLYRQMQMRLEVAAYAKDWVSVPVLVPFFQTANSPAEVVDMFLNARARGREGVMVKQPHALYERKRTDGWLKMKPEAEADGVITELLEAHATVDDPERGVRTGDALGRIGSVRVRMPDGSEACPHGIAHDLGVEMKRNPHAFLGEWCEFNYMERDRQDGYRHPTFNRVREAKQ